MLGLMSYIYVEGRFITTGSESIKSVNKRHAMHRPVLAFT